MAIPVTVPVPCLQADKEEIEEELEYEELRIIRERIFFKLRRENKVVRGTLHVHVSHCVSVCVAYVCSSFVSGPPPPAPQLPNQVEQHFGKKTKNGLLFGSVFVLRTFLPLFSFIGD